MRSMYTTQAILIIIINGDSLYNRFEFLAILGVVKDVILSEVN